MFLGFPTRLENEILALYKNTIQKADANDELAFDIDVVNPPRRKYNVFIGEECLRILRIRARGGGLKSRRGRIWARKFFEKA